MKKLLLTGVLLCAIFKGYSQAHLDQNGWKTSVIEPQSAIEAPMRYEIAEIGYNSYHWQLGGLMIVELFQNFYSTGYEKYIIEIGFGQGANSGSPVLKLVESLGLYHNARIVLGSQTDLSSSVGGYANKSTPVYIDVKDYSTYRVKITYMQAKVDVVTDQNQIKIVVGASGVSIPNFTPSTVLDNSVTSSGNLMITGNGNHYIQNGNLGIGTTDPKGYKLAVAGNMIAESVKVKLQGTWPDYVFAKGYELPSLQETEKHIKEQGCLPGIPSAAEVKTNGVDLGDMNAKLLQKIEELTLYLIEQDRMFKSKLSDQQKEIDELKSKFK